MPEMTCRSWHRKPWKRTWPMPVHAGTHTRGREGRLSLVSKLHGIPECSRRMPSHFTGASFPWNHDCSTSNDRNDGAGDEEGKHFFTHHPHENFLVRKSTSHTFPPQCFLLSCHMLWMPDPEVYCTVNGGSELGEGVWRAVTNSLHPQPSIPLRNSTLAHSDRWHWSERWPWSEFRETLLSLEDMRRDCQNSSTCKRHLPRDFIQCNT